MFMPNLSNGDVSWILQFSGMLTFRNLSTSSEEMIACPILVYDPALKLLAYSRMYPGLDDRIFQTAIANGYLDLETVKYFEKERIFAQMDHTGSAVGEPDNFRMHADFARAINIRNRAGSLLHFALHQ